MVAAIPEWKRKKVAPTALSEVREKTMRRCAGESGRSPKRIEPAMYEIIKHEKTRPWGGDTSPTVNAGVHSMTKAYMADSVAAETIMIVSKRPSERMRPRASAMRHWLSPPASSPGSLAPNQMFSDQRKQTSTAARTRQSAERSNESVSPP